MMKHTLLVCICWFVTQYKYSLTYGCETHDVFRKVYVANLEGSAAVWRTSSLCLSPT